MRLLEESNRDKFQGPSVSPVKLKNRLSSKKDFDLLTSRVSTCVSDAFNEQLFSSRSLVKSVMQVVLDTVRTFN